MAEELAIRRVLLLHALAFAHGGLPLIYMGDELGLRNDPAWADDPAPRRRQPLDAPPADGLGGRRAPARPGVRPRAACGPGCGASSPPAARTRAVHAQGRAEPLWTGNDHVFGLRREHAGERLLLLANFTAARAGRARSASRATATCRVTDAAAVPDGRPLGLRGDSLVLGPYQYLWLPERSPAEVLVLGQPQREHATELCRQVRTRRAGCRVVLYATPAVAVAAALAGAHALVDRAEEPDVLVRAIWTVGSGGRVLPALSPEMVRRAAAPLAPADQAIMAMLLAGTSAAEAAAVAGLSPRHLEGRRAAILATLAGRRHEPGADARLAA